MKREPTIYTFRGSIERPSTRHRRPSYRLFDGYSATTEDGAVLYPWMTKRECRAEAKADGKRAVFVQNLAPRPAPPLVGIPSVYNLFRA